MLFDASSILANQRVVVAYAAAAAHQDDSLQHDSLDFFAAIARLQGRAAAREQGATPHVTFDLDRPDAQLLVQTIDASGELAPSSPVTPIDSSARGEIAATLRAGAQLIARARPAVGDAIGLATSIIVAARVSALSSGSDPRVVGAFWLSPTLEWTAGDFAAALVHETVHQLLFVEDMVHGLFVPDAAELRKPDLLVTSPIRGTRRPLDVSFHAAIVSSTLLDLAVNCGIGNCDPAAPHRLQRTIDELHSRRMHLTTRGGALLDAISAQTNEIGSRP
jgi:hypothetical protein